MNNALTIQYCQAVKDRVKLCGDVSLLRSTNEMRAYAVIIAFIGIVMILIPHAPNFVTYLGIGFFLVAAFFGGARNKDGTDNEDANVMYNSDQIKTPHLQRKYCEGAEQLGNLSESEKLKTENSILEELKLQTDFLKSISQIAIFFFVLNAIGLLVIAYYVSRIQ